MEELIFENGFNPEPFKYGGLEGAVIKRKKVPEIDPFEKYMDMTEEEKQAQLKYLEHELKVLRRALKEEETQKRYFEAKKCLFKKAKNQYQQIFPIPGKTFDECFTIEGKKLYLWFNIANHSTKMVHTDI